MTANLGKTGIYMRLSRDDEKAGESMSVENQRLILRKFVAERGGDIIDEYVDDGWSGTNFDRPEVKRLLEDAQSGRIDTIVVKDLSRFGRNYIQVGQYIDYIFPAYGIRFIAISDNVDTADRCSAAMDMMPIMNVFNEWHAANTSKKIRAVLDASRLSGKYTSWNYPYGYKAGTDGNRTAVIDEEAAAVVKRIFAMRVEGKSSRAIARKLTGEGIPNPATYFTKLDGGKWDRPCSPYWCPSTVVRILSDPTYTGSTVQRKTTSVSYKNRKVVNLPPSEYIVRENAHEAIVSRDVWDRVREINESNSRGKADKSDKVHALSGLLVCPDCGKKLKLKTAKGKSGRGSNCGFLCRTYVDLGKKYCSSHAVTEREIEGIVLDDLKSMLGSDIVDESAARELFYRSREKRNARSSNEIRLKALKKRVAELDKLIQLAFEDRVLKGVPESVFANLCEKYEKERAIAAEETAKIEKRLAAEDVGEDAEDYVKKLKSYAQCKDLTREMCLQLIDRVFVGENSANGVREIHVFYKFSDKGCRL